MVRLISNQEQLKMNAAAHKIAEDTTVQIVTIVVPASDTYTHYIMILGFIVASLLALGLWYGNILWEFPNLLCIQLATACVFPFIPGMRTLAIKLLPKALPHHRAAQLAAEKRLAVTKHAHPQTPILLIFISCAENYIHIFPNAAIREKIPDKQWDSVVRKLIHAIPRGSLGNACFEAIEASGDLLKSMWLSH